jgi:hypothetical protein
MKECDVERLTDGVSFTKVATRAPAGNGTFNIQYHWPDLAPPPGHYYYRMRSISNNEVIGLRNAAQVNIHKSTPAIFVFPNP